MILFIDIETIKYKIRIYSISSDQQYFIFTGKQLDDNEQLYDYTKEKSSIISLV